MPFKDYIPQGLVVELNEPLNSFHFNKTEFEIINERYLYCETEASISKLQKHIKVKSTAPYCDLFVRTPPLPPHLKYNIKDSYLGDYHFQDTIKLNLSLKDRPNDIIVLVQGDLPPGLEIKNNYLAGRPSKIDKLYTFSVSTQNGKHLRKFFIRIYTKDLVRNSFTYNNYIRLGFGEHYQEYSPSNVYYRNIYTPDNNIIESVSSPIEVATDLALKLYHQASQLNLDLFLYSSGGIDSQCMIQAFIKAQVPFTAIFMLDINGTNTDDYNYFNCFKNKYQFNHEVIEVNFLEFIMERKYLSMAFDYRFNNPEYGLLLSLMDHYQGYHVYAGRPCSVNKSLNNERILGLAVDETWSKARYLERNGKNGCPEFLSGSLELVKSFLSTPLLQNFDHIRSRWYYSDKIRLLKQSGFDTEHAPPTKLTGFENLRQKLDAYDYNIWVQDRFPLKKFFPNTIYRGNNIISDKIHDKMGLKYYPDGFSWSYLQKENIEDYH